MLEAVTYVAVLGASIVSLLRWLRIAQREEYIAGYVLRFAVRWWSSRPVNSAILVVAIAAAALSWLYPASALVTAALVVIAPLGLHLRGRTSGLGWTSRLLLVLIVVLMVDLSATTIGIAFGLPITWVASIAIAQPIIVDFALLITSRVERVILKRWIARASARLGEVRPRTIGITGSFGKTSTTSYLAHILAATSNVVASRENSNNAVGLARMVNKDLRDSTQFLIAEMGTYARGEIADLCGWIRPEVAVITAIAPVHLERMGSLDEIARAKAEILDKAEIAVLCIDYPQLRDMVSRFAQRGRVITFSVRDASADVFVDLGASALYIEGRQLPCSIAPTAHAGNVAGAVGAALAVGVAPSEIGRRLGDLPAVPQRREVRIIPGGPTIIDDTFTSNPSGAASALSLLASLGATSQRRVVVTPGMMELGRIQDECNQQLARDAASVATDVVVVGSTNRRALENGARGGSARVFRAADRDAAIAWVRKNVAVGDVVLYENDLPDHVP